jgi:hypothetical protein
MIAKTLQCLSAAALVVASAVIAEPSATDAPSANGNANKQICRTIADTGSRLGRYRACHTAQEWTELRRQTKQTVDHIQNARPWNCPGCGP